MAVIELILALSEFKYFLTSLHASTMDHTVDQAQKMNKSKSSSLGTHYLVGEKKRRKL